MRERESAFGKGHGYWVKGETGKWGRGRYKVGMRVPGAECIMITTVKVTYARSAARV